MSEVFTVKSVTKILLPKHSVCSLPPSTCRLGSPMHHGCTACSLQWEDIFLTVLLTQLLWLLILFPWVVQIKIWTNPGPNYHQYSISKLLNKWVTSTENKWHIQMQKWSIKNSTWNIKSDLSSHVLEWPFHVSTCPLPSFRNPYAGS